MTVTYTNDADSRLSTEVNSQTGTTNYTYDDNGNQITKGSETYTYNGLNQLTGITGGAQSVSYTYNGDGQRRSKTVGSTTSVQIWDGDQVVLELDGAGTVTNKYVRGINLLYSEDGSGSNVKCFLYNGHGDAVKLANTSGDVIKSYDYDAFGVEKNIDVNDTNAFRYCGEYFDKETGSVYLRARYYAPGIGRFITEDDIKYSKDKDPLSLNLYTYCTNNPVLLTDPSGHFPIVLSALYFVPGAGQVLLAATAVIVTVAVLYEGGKIVQSKIKEANQKKEEKAKETADKDARLKGKPGDINKTKDKETKIGEDSRAKSERHKTTHGNPKVHSNPHDHNINWGKDGKPNFGPPINYPNGAPKFR